MLRRLDETASTHRRPRIVYLVTSSPSAVFFDGQLAYMRRRGFDVWLVAAPGDDHQLIAERNGVPAMSVPMEREITPLRDVGSLFRLLRMFRQLRPNIVVAATPKAALLAMLAAWTTRVPVRVCLQYGLRLETTRGFKRRILAVAERITSAAATRVVCVSASLRDQLVGQGLAAAEKTVVLAAGSSHGVDAARFARSEPLLRRAAAIRAELGIPSEAPVVGFVGRLTRDKGIAELWAAFQRLRTHIPQAWLLLVGDFESGDPVPEECVRQLTSDPQVRITGFVRDVPPYYHATQVIAFPSFREGMPNVPLEAAAAGLAVVGFRATGTVDAVVDGLTGTLVPSGDWQALELGLRAYLQDSGLRMQHGEAAYHRILHVFRPAAVWEAFFDEYVTALKAAGQPQPRASARLDPHQPPSGQNDNPFPDPNVCTQEQR